jgi:hypothetical protein
MVRRYQNVSDPEMIITLAHVKQAGFCLNVGARRWCLRNGIDFRRLSREGIPEEEAAHLNCALMRKVIEVAHGQQEKANDRL